MNLEESSSLSWFIGCCAPGGCFLPLGVVQPWVPDGVIGALMGRGGQEKGPPLTVCWSPFLSEARVHKEPLISGP